MSKRTNLPTACTSVLAVALSIASPSVLTVAGAAQAAEGTPLGPGLVLPPMNSANGRELFASKGCVVCHAVNGVGGTDAPKIDASTMAPEMSPFDFVAKMWNHSQGMIAMQMNELGHQITFNDGQEIADIIAFLHDAAEQKKFTEDDIPAGIREHMEEDMDMGGSAESK
jgi:mono/diheme cytochrome c family protein